MTAKDLTELSKTVKEGLLKNNIAFCLLRCFDKCVKMLSKALCFVFLLVCAFSVNGKFVTKIEHLNDGSVRAYGFKGNDVKPTCTVNYNNTYLTLGWDVVEIETNPEASDVDQAYCAGEIEGLVTYDAIYFHYRNTVQHWCKGRDQTCSKIQQFLQTHFDWLKKQIKKKANKQQFWYHINLFWNQLVGIQQGYVDAILDPKKTLSLQDFIMMNLLEELDDLADALEGDASGKLRGEGHCSAIVKLLPDNQDLLVGHNTWTSFTKMYRMLKRYTIPLRLDSKSKKTVPGSSISFSGYPAVITSQDDFYVASSGLVAMETTIGNSNASLWQYVKPTGQILESVRSLVATRLASNGKTWCKTFSRQNSGTYNNEWMIVDFNKFKSGSEPQTGTLYVLEQIPGYIRYEDQTHVLTQQMYWPSYNTAFYTDVFVMSGNQALVDQYGDWFSYNNTARAEIFRRDHVKVTDSDSLLQLLRSNDFKHDPLAACNCTPPYSGENALAARSDLNPAKGKYPFPALGHRLHGAIDAKVVSPATAQNLTFLAICGPTTGTNLPAFKWSKSDFKHMPHHGQPDTFTRFKPVLWTWLGHFL